MGTARFRPLIAGVAISLICVGCGTAHRPAGGASRQTGATHAGASGSTQGGATPASAASGSGSGFGWFAAKPPPEGWRLARIPSGAVLPYPPSWRSLHGDPGTATAALRRSDGAYLGYLNITPRQGEESLANWPSFRVEHNREEGDTDVKELAFARSLHFRTGHGTCIKDSYLGGTGDRYVEVACLIAGSRTSVVAVGAAPPSDWPKQAATLERAIEGVQG
jgi:hypothetical protein